MFVQIILIDELMYLSLCNYVLDEFNNKKFGLTVVYKFLVFISFL